ncbi:E3 ubiquitin-protein ligase TRAIP [Malaya genurostris]|uniref:E3 ubiquitin-protein ligase TRAIP n=1 Tax=Malaya genurostris TaxID=325434 RepID=UPI0026F400BB|nr:E3 ubiquitin-protein ligase TRAIP [Malaya genurostris]XP_058456195.1 E3 ubiquitin-protein ligase TRAIP [Malaya genurostris]
MNLTCAICSDLFMPSDDVHMTPCGHSFHFACLLQWLQRSKTCPQCRNKCHEKSLIKVYFNIAANTDAPEDAATLLHKLDNLTLSVREKEKKLKEFEDKDASHKLERKKMKKTLSALEDMVKSKDFTIYAYKQETEMLRGDRAQMQKLQAELKELKAKMSLMSTIEHVVSSTAKEVEEMLAHDDNPRTLAVLVATLKRELKASDAKKHEMRERMKSIQNDLHDERSKRKQLEDKLSTADSEIYRLEQEVKRLEKNALDASTDSESIVLNTPDQHVKRKRLEKNLDNSTPMSDKVQNILQSDSPYFSIKSSSIGLTPLFRAGLGATSVVGTKCPEAGQLTKAQSDLSEKFSIFRKPRLTGTTHPINKNIVYNGLGGSERKENFPSFPEPKIVKKESASASKTTSKSSSSITSRLKAGTLRKHPSTSVTTSDHDKFEFLDIPLED